MHYRVSRGDERKVVKGKVACKTDIYWVARSSHLIFPTVLLQMTQA